MIVVSVMLISARNGQATELARMNICNDGHGTDDIGHYKAATLRGRSTDALSKNVVSRQGQVRDWPRHRLHVWNLVATALHGMGYGRGKAGEQPALLPGLEGMPK